MIDNKWENESVVSVAKAFIQQKHIRTWGEISDEISKIFPQYEFTEIMVRKWWSRYKQNHDINLVKKDGRINIKTRDIIKYEFDHEIEIVFLYDTHGLDYNADYNIFRNKIDYIENNENVVAILGGDLMNIATRTSLSTPYGSDDPQRELIVVSEELKRIKDKILGSVIGNHEARGIRGDGIDPARELASRIGIEHLYFGNIGILNLIIKGTSYLVCFQHGNRGSGSRTKTGQMISAIDLQKIYPNCDWYVVGHSHISGFYIGSIREVDNIEETIKARYQYYLCAGSTFGFENSYGEAKMYEPQPILLAHLTLTGEIFSNGEKGYSIQFKG